MKNFFNVTHKNSAKAVAYIVIFFAFVAFAAYLVGCGNDNPIDNGNNNNSNNTIIFSLDSLAIITPPYTADTGIWINDINSIAITFTAETNADSVNGWSLFQVFALDSANALIFDTTYNATLHMNNNFRFDVNNINNSAGVSFRIQCLRNPPFVFFMKLKNIKIIKVS